MQVKILKKDLMNFVSILPPVFFSTLDVVSVNSSNKSVISWTPSSSTDVVMYYIDILSPFSGWNTIDSVAAPATSYTYNASNAANDLESFQIRARDSCRLFSGNSLTHNSILLTSELDVCEYSIYFDWNDYKSLFLRLGPKILIMRI